MVRSQDSRERLIDAAHRLACVKGFDRTSLSELLVEAGVKKGTLYHYFPDKDALGLEVLERCRTEFLAMLDSALSVPNPLKGLERLFRAALRQHAGAGFVGGCVWGNTALEMSDTKSAFSEAVKAVFREWIERIEGAIRAGQDAHEIRADLPAGELAHLVVATMEGGIMLSRLTKKKAPLQQCLRALRGILSTPGDAGNRAHLA